MNRRTRANHDKPRVDPAPEPGVAVTSDGFSVVLSIPWTLGPAVVRLSPKEVDSLIAMLVKQLGHIHAQKHGHSILPDTRFGGCVCKQEAFDNPDGAG